MIDRRLMEAAITGDSRSMMDMASQDPSMLLGTTPQGNTCLHISSLHGHEGFCMDVLVLNQSLLAVANSYGETPLLTAVTSGHASLASDFLRRCCALGLSEAILKQDKDGCNALHHAIRTGHKDIALELIAAEPTLSQFANKFNESPMYIAAMRDFVEVFEELLEVPNSAHMGDCRCNALHAAVRNGNSSIAKKIMEKRPQLAREAAIDNAATPMLLAVLCDKVDVLRVMLEHDWSLGSVVSTDDGTPLLTSAAARGHVGVARELLDHCPDAPYCDAHGWTCLHEAVYSGHTEFVEFILRGPQFRKLVNMRDRNGKTALHLAVQKYNPKIVAALLFHKDIDFTMLDNNGNPAAWELESATDHAKTLHWIIATASTGSSRETMNDTLRKAAITSNSQSMKDMASQDPSVLLGTTPHGNTCLHISSLHGHEGFCMDVLVLNQSLLAVANSYGETPLLAAVTSGHASLASDFLRRCRALGLSEAILKQDKDGCNALHHAICSGHKDIALELIATEPALSQSVNNVNESPMYMAVMRDFVEVFEKLLEVPNSAHTGACGYNALHAAVRNGNSGIAKKIMEKRPWLAREENKEYSTPVHLAVLWDKVDVLRVMLEHDWSLGSVLCTDRGTTLLNCAAYRGHVGVARELLDHCPDTPYRNADGWTCLHEAVCRGHPEFVEFILRAPQLRRLVNMRSSEGKAALHYAVQNCNPKIVAALLFYKDIDLTMLDNNCNSAAWELENATDHAKTLNWNEVSMLMLKADPRNATVVYNLHVQAKEKVTVESRKDIKSLTQTYTSNTSLVAILIATITFAAAFTLPGGYSTDSGSEGLPIMARKFAFQAFLISDTLAMCSSLVVSFTCIIARWEDLEFLLYYRSFTKKLMWFAYIATTTAFATGLYTVLAPRLQWLAIAICFLPVLLPVLAKLLGEWPVLKLIFRLGQTFKSNLLSMV